MCRESQNPLSGIAVLKVFFYVVRSQIWHVETSDALKPVRTKISGAGNSVCVCVCYLAASLLFEGFGDKRGAALDDGYVFYPPALWQLGVRGDLDQLQAHLLPQGACQASKLPLSFGQVYRHLSVPAAVVEHFPEGLWDAANDGMREAAVRAHVRHDATDQMRWKVPSVRELAAPGAGNENTGLRLYLGVFEKHQPNSKRRWWRCSAGNWRASSSLHFTSRGQQLEGEPGLKEKGGQMNIIKTR